MPDKIAQMVALRFFISSRHDSGEHVHFVPGSFTTAPLWKETNTASVVQNKSLQSITTALDRS